MKTKILITGANGQLGKTIKELYGNDNSLEIVFKAKQELDITNNLELNTFFKAHNFDYCINCAAYTNVEKSETNPDLAFQVNADGVKNVAQQCKGHGIVLIHISTDYVFDGTKQTPYLEDDKTNPINQYGKSKLSGEQFVQDILDNYFVIRTSWLYSVYGNNFLKTIIQKIKNKEQIQIITTQKGTPTSCSDLAKFIFYLIKHKVTAFGIYHFSPSGETTWYEYAMRICKHFKAYDCKKIKPTETLGSLTKRPEYSVLDITKSKDIFKREIFWQESVDNTVRSLIK